MENTNKYDVVIIGGSYAGLSAALSLGRGLRKTLVIDSGNPCNRSTPHSHNFLTHDGDTPSEIRNKALEEVKKYNTVSFLEDEVTAASGENLSFELRTASGGKIHAEKLLFATGVRDTMPPIKGFSDCWGISVIHCPYCHGYEYKFQHTGILANGPMAYEYARLISNWTSQLTVFTNGSSTIDETHMDKLRDKGIEVIDTEIEEIVHEQGYLKTLLLKDGKKISLDAIYNRPVFRQHCDLPGKLGCEMTEHGYISTNDFRQTSVPGVYAAGDNTTPMRSVANAVASGTVAASCINHELVEERF